MSKFKVDVTRGSELADTEPTRAGNEARPTQDFVTTAATIGVIAAGAALFEVALIPGMVIGGAAVLAPKFGVQATAQASVGVCSRCSTQPSAGGLCPRFPCRTGRALSRRWPPVPGLDKQAMAKTITFRLIVTALDFTMNYVVLGDLTMAAGLSAFGLVVGPLFYFAHEAAWNYFGPSDKRVDLPALLTPLAGRKGAVAGRGGITINRALAKTITFRTIATTTDFTTNYVVVGDLATAAPLSAFGFVLGPFVYLGHEIVWDFMARPERARPNRSANKAPAGAGLRVATTQRRISLKGLGKTNSAQG